MKNIVLLASGSGSNAENIIRYFDDHSEVTIKLICTNNPKAGVLERAKKLNVPSYVFDRQALYDGTAVLDRLIEENTDLIVLAGFLWLIPDTLVKYYSGRMLNIHPALLPDYGGKGMYGDRVHQAVLDAGEKLSGITIHTVDGEYDRGKLIFQASCSVYKDDTSESLSQRIHSLEYGHYPRIIERFIGLV